MKRVKDDETHAHVELTTEEARQGLGGRHVLYMLIGVVVGTVIVIGLVYLSYF